MKINTKQWRKIRTEDKYTILQDSRNNELRISHTTLSPKHREALEALPVYMSSGGHVAGKKPVHMYDGGYPDEKKKEFEVERIEDQADSAMKEIDLAKQLEIEKLDAPAAQDPLPSASAPVSSAAPVIPGMIDIAQAQAELGQPVPAMSGPTASPGIPGMDPVVPQEAPMDAQRVLGGGEGLASGLGLQQDAAAPAAPIDPLASQMLSQQGVFDQKRAGLTQEADAISAQAKQEAAIAQKKAKDMAVIEATYGQQLNDVNNNIMLATKDYQNGHIDKDRVWAEASMPKKILTAIGLLAGGFGVAMGAKQNPALEYINQEIDRDIDAQKADVHNKGNALNSMIAQAGNLRSGMEMMKSLKLGIAAADMEKAAATAKDPIAQARLKQASADLTQMQLTYNQKVAAQMTMQQMLKAVQKDPSMTGAVVDAAERVDPEKGKDLREREIPSIGFARTKEDATALKEMRGGVLESQDGIAKLLKIANKPLKELSLVERGSVETLRGTLRGALRLPITGPGALNESELKLLESIIADPTAIFSFDAVTKARLNTLSEALGDKFAAAAKARGINVASSSEKSSAHEDSLTKKAQELLKKDPNHKAAKAHMQRIGSQ